MVRYWKQQYCDKDHTACARHRGMIAGEPVPLTLLPSGAHLKLPPSSSNQGAP